MSSVTSPCSLMRVNWNSSSNCNASGLYRARAYIYIFRALIVAPVLDFLVVCCVQAVDCAIASSLLLPSSYRKVTSELKWNNVAAFTHRPKLEMISQRRRNQKMLEQSTRASFNDTYRNLGTLHLAISYDEVLNPLISQVLTGELLPLSPKESIPNLATNV